MISYRSTLIFATCITCLGSILGEYHNPRLNSAIAYSSVASSLQVAQGELELEQLPLKKGSQGELVIALQEKLKQLGYYNGSTDGNYSEATELALIEFQKSVGLEADGIVGPATWNILEASAVEITESEEVATPQPDAGKVNSNSGKLLLLLLSIILFLGTIGGGFFLLSWWTKPKKSSQPQFPPDEDGYLNTNNSESVWLEANNNGLEETEGFEHPEPSNLQGGIIDQTEELDHPEPSNLQSGSINQTEELDQTEALDHPEPSNLQGGIIDQTEELDQTEALEHPKPSNVQSGIIDQTEELDQTEALDHSEPSNVQSGIIDQTEELDQTEALDHSEPSNVQSGVIDRTEELDRTESSNHEYHNNGYNPASVAPSLPHSSQSHQIDNRTNSYHSSPGSSNLPTPITPPAAEDNLPLETTTRLAKINIVDELIKDLRQPNPQKRRKAIWELARQGDSRAVKPLVDLMMVSDSQQRSLILEALSQIGNKTLKPLNRALAISLQDDNAQVRKNAIRDLTRIYEMVAQMSQMLCHAADDPDPEVKETAEWAINQLSRIRTSSTFDNLPPSEDASKHK
ncbi:MAG: hypothetical protein F6J92_30125 [Symploca sp. SIO1A3]|nr:hypothetical protein [Symploca sp. SIO1A3]